MSDFDKNDHEFKPDLKHLEVPMVKHSDPLKEGIPVSDANPIESGIRKRHEEIRSMRSIGDFMALKGSKMLKVNLNSSVPPLGKHIEVASVLMTEEPVFPSSSLGCKTRVEILGGPSNASPSAKLAELQKRMDDTAEGKPAKEAHRIEEPKPGVSIERLVFLERVEKIMASEARIKEIEAENKTLVGMVARLNKELDELKAKQPQKL